MPLTLAQVEVKMVGRIGRMLAAVGLDGTTVDGTNPTLAEPIRAALVALGLTTTTSDAATDADLEALSDADLGKFLYLVEYYALESAWGSYVLVDQSLGSESQSLSQLRDAFLARLKWLRDLVGHVIDPISTPGPAAHGLIRAGQCYPPRGANGHVRTVWARRCVDGGIYYG